MLREAIFLTFPHLHGELFKLYSGKINDIRKTRCLEQTFLKQDILDLITIILCFLHKKLIIALSSVIHSIELFDTGFSTTELGWKKFPDTFSSFVELASIENKDYINC